MAKHRAVIVGAGRIGAGWNWHDDAYTHAGAYWALKDRVELAGFVEPNPERAKAAAKKWGVPSFAVIEAAFDECEPDIVSVCVQPEQQLAVFEELEAYPPEGIWCEKPYTLNGSYIEIELVPISIQVNYLRRADKLHQWMAREKPGGVLKVYGKDDLHTRCHFEDLAAWWKATLEYHPEFGDCRYYYCHGPEENVYAFPHGGLERPGDQMRDMLANLLDHIEGKAELWSPPT